MSQRDLPGISSVMIYRIFFSFSILVGTLFLTQTAGAADDLQWEIVNRVLLNKDKPTITLSTGTSIKRAVLNVTRKKGDREKTERFVFGSIRANRSKTITLASAPGQWTYQGQLELSYKDGRKGDIPVSFDVIVAKALEIEAPYELMDLSNGIVQVKLSRTASECNYSVWTEGNEVINGVASFEGAAAQAGEWLAVRWEPYTPEDVVLRMDLECFDTDGFSNGLELSPWKIEVPHEDVNFASGRHQIHKNEQHKIIADVEQILTTIKRYSHVLKLKVFVSGHTDSVGSKETNKALSKRRARAIAKAFRKHGVQVPLHYIGYGEERQAIQTADEVPEARNRRARYIIAVHPPTSCAWKRL